MFKSNWMFRLFLLLSFFNPLPVALASTFVGNGGSLLDSELRRSLETLRSSIKAAQISGAPCTCSIASEQCKLLDSLDEKKDNYCQVMIKKVSRPLLSLLSDKQKPSFRWTNETISHGAGKRSFDAITQRKEKIIILQEARFAKLKEPARVQLLAHELLHLLVIDGQSLGDEGDYGPFAGEEGGRELLDTLGAVYGAMAVDEGLIAQRGSKVSHPAQSFYLSSGNAIAFVEPALAKELRVKRTLDGGQLALEWYGNPGSSWGLAIASRWQGAEKRGSYLRRFQWNSYDLGLISRIRPLDTDSDFWSAIQLHAYLGISQSRAYYMIQDDFQKMDQAKKSYGVIGELGLKIPLVYNFWLYASGGRGWSAFRLEDFEVSSKKTYNTQSTGVAYGFSF